MKRVVAELLRHRTVWQLVAIATLCVVAGLLLIYNSYSSTLRQMQPLLVLIFATGGAALFMAVVRRAERGGGWSSFIAVVLGIAGVIAFVTYSAGHFATVMVASCNAARLPPTLAERRAALAQAEANLRSPFALLPALYDDGAARECARSRGDIARADEGKCLTWPIVGHACDCGAERYPYARCPEPRCLWDEGVPDRFDCPGDPVPQGYPNF